MKLLLLILLLLSSPVQANTLFNTTQLQIIPTATDITSGVKFVTLSPDGETWGDDIAYPVEVTDWPWTEGVNTIYAKFIDAAGNVGPVVSVQVVIDTLPPTDGQISIKIITTMTTQ